MLHAHRMNSGEGVCKPYPFLCCMRSPAMPETSSRAFLQLSWLSEKYFSSEKFSSSLHNTTAVSPRVLRRLPRATRSRMSLQMCHVKQEELMAGLGLENKGCDFAHHLTSSSVCRSSGITS